jgi:hypothetical protein
MDRPRPNREFGVVLGMLLAIAVPATISLLGVKHALDVSYRPGTNPSPYGYTLSLALFVVPAATILWWFLRQSRYHLERRAFYLTLVWSVASGVVLDVLFGNSFFTFPNALATLPLRAPGYDPRVGWTASIPLEEFAFYILGFATILLVYVWSNVYWCGAYCADQMEERAARVDRLLRIHAKSGIVAIAFLVVAIAFKYLGPHSDRAGFPGYLTYLTFVAVVPSLLLFDSAKPLINWRALSLTAFVLMLVSLLWEVTLAIPYGWWGYRERQMVGLFVPAWGRLPIEAVLVWIASTWGTVILYESMRLLLHMHRPISHALFGRRAPAPEGPTKR